MICAHTQSDWMPTRAGWWCRGCESYIDQTPQGSWVQRVLKADCEPPRPAVYSVSVAADASFDLGASYRVTVLVDREDGEALGAEERNHIRKQVMRGLERKKP